MNFSLLQKFIQIKYYIGVKTSTEEEEETEQPIEEPISEEEAIMNVSLSFSK